MYICIYTQVNQMLCKMMIGIVFTLYLCIHVYCKFFCQYKKMHTLVYISMFIMRIYRCTTIHVHIYIYKCVYIHIYICTYICMYKYIFLYTYMYVCVYVYMYVYIYINKYKFLYIYIYIFIYIYIRHFSMLPRSPHH
jgi:hypothetical protein